MTANLAGPGDTSAEPVTRREFLYVATVTMASVGAAVALWPFVDQIEPATGVLAEGGPISVDLSTLSPGQQILVMWQRKPIFIVSRTTAVLKGLKESQLLAQLRDPYSGELQQPNYAKNWSRSIKPEYLVVVGVCTHLGCIPTFTPSPGALNPSWPGGYLCHCHGSKYDLAGRVFKGVPAPLNLPVPPHHFASNTVLVIGENPVGESFDMNSVEQV